MKQATLLLLVTLLFASCQKETSTMSGINGTGSPIVVTPPSTNNLLKRSITIKTDVVYPLKKDTTVTFLNYDNSSRVTSLIDSAYPKTESYRIVFTYSGTSINPVSSQTIAYGSIVAQNTFQYNSSGQPLSFISSPTDLTTYTYSTNLIVSTEIFGTATRRSMEVDSFFYDNSNNIFKIVYTSSDYPQTYKNVSTDNYTYNSYLNPLYSINVGFIAGPSSKNLIASRTSAGVISAYAYSYDSKNRVIKDSDGTAYEWY